MWQNIIEFHKIRINLFLSILSIKTDVAFYLPNVMGYHLISILVDGMQILV
jgi:hypothetical protein